MTPSVRRLLLVTHGDAAVTAATLPALAAALAAQGVELVLNEDEVAKHPDLQPISVDRPDDVDLILVLGGDGTMLRALHRVIDRPVACVGVNYGTFGFLTTMRANEMLERLPDVLGGGLEVMQLPTVSVETPDGRFVAINDVLVTADQLGRMAVLEWSVNGVDLGQRGCDGILVATPAGSTGYNLSAGGPVIEWGVDAVVVSFVAPHSLDARPLILARGHEVRVTSRTRDVGSRVVVDGHAHAMLGTGETATIGMAPETARLAILPDRPFVSRYRDKFGR
ncbi:MAG: NAD(+)/NADH kinase [Gaiellales bacterium]